MGVRSERDDPMGLMVFLIVLDLMGFVSTNIFYRFRIRVERKQILLRSDGIYEKVVCKVVLHATI